VSNDTAEAGRADGRVDAAAGIPGFAVCGVLGKGAVNGGGVVRH
jgi:hypothetical protein